ncbi:MAG: DNA-directed RNA polymerase [Candidatus Thermoplasmatota archaeon]|nr:DNA-directed RNA polymerase [Euryarchaeota archaeon]MBU4070967.1 DNA-directed RNA polymerase [Candidatus Thermoplasmatota archaeon]MBU4144860.1 DNA-directed RNA polymerase [Candidatus Thermoplasmatota archaeon]MBU4592173.1 DNA-directed RNA polymerase [Candidatus Thermoplasmatota archaeon]
MYLKEKRKDVIRIPPERLGEDLTELSQELTQHSFEGKIVGDKSLIVLTTSITPMGEGRIVHGDGAVYQDVEYDALIFRLDNQEIVEGSVCEILKFGAFVRFGPLDGLLHISQVMDDHIDVDVDNQRLTGKETRRDIRLNNEVRARIVTVSVNERNPRESKIGLTMRQSGLGRLDWLQDNIKNKEAS